MNANPSVSAFLYNIVMAYFRKGKLSDLVHIIDKMLTHLNAINTQQNPNQKIIQHIAFDKKKQGISEFIAQVSQFNKQLMSLVDSGCHTALAAATAVVGAILVLGFSLLPALVGLILIAGGAYSTYAFATDTYMQLTKLTPAIQSILEKTNNLPR